MAILKVAQRIRFPFFSRGKKYVTIDTLDVTDLTTMDVTFQKRLDFYKKCDDFKIQCTRLKQFSIDQTHVSLTLANQLISSEAKQTNLVFSPLSIHVVLGLIASGSTGRTQDEVLRYFNTKSSDEFNESMSQVASILFADGSSHGGPQLSCVNGVWVDKRFALKERFKEIVDNVYKADTEQVDFKNQAEKERKKLNLWAEEKTNGLIKEVLPQCSVHELTRLVFGNAVYFKGAWNKIFTKSRTRDYDFFLLNGTTVEVPFMTASERQRVSAFDGFKVLSLDCKQGEDIRNFAMYIFLPDSKDGFPSLVEKVTDEPGFIERHLPHEFVEVGDFRIPKFKICFSFNAAKVLEELGLVSTFSDGLTEMVDEDLNVDGILHKSFIQVNEEGTEAAAVSMGMEVGCDMYMEEEEKFDFVADRPFLFVIREDTTGMLLFVGHVLNPLIE